MIKFKLFKTDVEINFLFVAVVTLLLLTDKSGFAIIGFVACLMHELGHIAAFFTVGAIPKLLSFEVSGIRLKESNNSLSKGKELFVLLAGSTVNLIVFFLIGGNNKLAIIHLALGVFNLLPLKSLDGGKILALLLSYFLPILWQEKICFAVDFIFTALIVLICIYCFFAINSNFTLLIMAGYLIISFIDF